MAFIRRWRSKRLNKLNEDWGLEADQSILEIELEDGMAQPEDFDVKYLGCTTLSAEKSQKATSAAIKSVLASTNKMFLRKKAAQPVLLRISPKGLEIHSKASSEILKQISIYKISCCSVDGAYDHIFSFAASDDDEILTCYVFMCPKKKVTQRISICVAKAFETAYNDWKENVERDKFTQILAASGQKKGQPGTREISVVIERCDAPFEDNDVNHLLIQI